MAHDLLVIILIYYAIGWLLFAAALALSKLLPEDNQNRREFEATLNDFSNLPDDFKILSILVIPGLLPILLINDLFLGPPKDD